MILGIAPDRPETGYGYIRAERAGAARSQVARFVEKPDAATAERYLARGGYFWNSGMFVVRASVWLAALERFRPDIAAATRAAWDGRSARRQLRAARTRRVFEAMPGESVDYAVMEKCPGAADFDIRMVPLAAGWSDLGAWDAVWQVAAEGRGRQRHRSATCCSSDSRDTLVHATSRLVGVVGLDDVVVVETPDAVLVADRERSQDVKHIVGAAATAEAQRAARCTARCTGPGAGTTASTPGRASRSSASWSSPAPS